MNQNVERVKEELVSLKNEYLSIIKRFKYVTLAFMKSRVPPSELHKDPRNNELFHLLTAFVEEWYDQAPRVNAYLFITTVMIGSGYLAINWPLN